MPLHLTGLVSRHELDHPDEKPPVKVSPLNYDRVLKFNPNHGADGRFAASGGGRKGGTAGAPTTDAFGSPLKPKRKNASPTYSSTQSRMDSGFLRGGPRTIDPSFHKGPATAPHDPGFHKGTPYKQALGTLPVTYPGSMVGGTPTKRSSFS